MKNRDKIIRFAFYGRASHERQDVENSIDGQRSAAQVHTHHVGGIIVVDYTDEAMSGRKASRPGFQQMIKDSSLPNPPFDAVIVWKINRFARNLKDVIRYWDQLEENGIRVISVMEPEFVGPAGRLMRNVIASFDEYFSESLGSDVKRGMVELVERGFYVGSFAAPGYRIVKVSGGETDEDTDEGNTRSKLALDPPWDELVKHIFELALKDRTTLDISRTVTDEGYRTKNGKKFTKTKIYKILTNENCTGFVCWDRDPITKEPRARSFKQAHPAIVSREVYVKVREKLKNRAPDIVHPRTAANEHLFNDIGKCSRCGGKIKIKSGKNGEYFYFLCKTRDDFGKQACDLPYYSITKNDPIIMRAILDDILTEENLRVLIDIVRAEAGPLNKAQQMQLAAIDEQIKTLNRREDRLIDSLEDAKIPTKKYNARVESIQVQMAEEEAKRAELHSLMGNEATILDDPELIVAYAKDMRTYLQQDNIKAVNSICKQFIKTIWFEPGFATIEHSIPIPDGTPTPRVKRHKVALTPKVRPTVPVGPPNNGEQVPRSWPIHVTVGGDALTAAVLLSLSCMSTRLKLPESISSTIKVIAN